MSTAYKNILVAVDGSKESEWALKKAIEITKRNDAALHLVHIIEYYHHPRDPGIFKQSQEEFGNNLLEEHKKRVEDEGIQEVSIILEYGSAKAKISKNIAEEVKADLIICGATGLNTVERILIGSVSENIVRSAQCDVLIVRTPKDKN